MPGVKRKREGRPLKFEDPMALQAKIDEYFAACDPHVEFKKEWVEARDSSGKLQKDQYGLNYLTEIEHHVMTEQEPYTITGLALALDTSRETLVDYEDGNYTPKHLDHETQVALSDTIKKAKVKCQRYAEKTLFSNIPTGAIFSLKNNYGWQDQTELKHSGKIDREMSTADLEAILERERGATQTGQGS